MNGALKFLFLVVLAYFAIPLSFGISSRPAKAGLIPGAFPNAVVALGSTTIPGQPIPQWFTEGTGILYGYLVQNDPNPARRKYEVYLVTNRHVIEEHQGANISVRLNPTNSSMPARTFDLPIRDASGKSSWFFHPDPNIDIAAIQLNGQILRDQGLLDVFFANDIFGANKKKLRELDIMAGDGVFVLGFPMNLTGAQRNYVIARQGCIARISDMLDGTDQSYLIDAFIFPGNSGSPVVLRPEITSIQGTKPQTTAYLIGIVRSYIPYTDVAISIQTKRPRISFEENSGLAEVLPLDYIDEAIKAKYH
jgi:S1-C subfamily serine protease